MNCLLEHFISSTFDPLDRWFNMHIYANTNALRWLLVRIEDSIAGRRGGDTRGAALRSSNQVAPGSPIRNRCGKGIADNMLGGFPQDSGGTGRRTNDIEQELDECGLPRAVWGRRAHR